MNLLQKKFLKRGNINTSFENGKLTIENTGTETAFMVLPKINFFSKTETGMRLSFSGTVEFGKAPQIKLLNRKMKTIFTANMNEETYLTKNARLFIFGMKVPGESKCVIETLNYEFVSDEKNKVSQFASGKTLLLAPGYPSVQNKYFFAFVHTRAQEYIKLGLDLDVLAVDDTIGTSLYSYEGIDVCHTNFHELRNLLQVKHYDTIIIHYFKPQFAQILNATDKSRTKIMIVSHGGDTLYRDFKYTTSKYFEPEEDYTVEQLENFAMYDKYIRQYAQMDNVTFQFGSHWSFERAKELTKAVFKHVQVIPNLVSEETFPYVKKDPELRKKIAIIRKFDNVATYSVDIDVQIILELSKKDFFDDLEFNVYGDGNYHSELVSPLRQFSNVHIHKKFLSHSEMAQVHKENGIALFATRYETQGVAAAEAAASGLVVLTSDVAAVPEVFGRDLENLFESNDYKAYAQAVEKLYADPEYFSHQSEKMSLQVNKTCGLAATMEKEITLLNQIEENAIPVIEYPEIEEKPLLTIAIPSYNCEKFIRNTVFSLINTDVASKLEVLIINDGSKDKTLELGKELQELTTVNGKSIVTMVDKENGGHGSTINKGIELATGKYFKLLDGDDYYDRDALEALVRYLETETSDIVLNNYVEDFSETCTTNVVRHYEFMRPGEQYDIDMLCYEGYGFQEWGPLLSTSSYKTQLLKDMNYKISEHCFYVDMELNFITFVNAKTVSYYPLDIYYYYLGRPGQSVSAESFKRNYKNHEHVTLRLLEDFYKLDVSTEKYRHLYSKIIIPMVVAQYYISIDVIEDRKAFVEFDKILKNYPEVYNDPKVALRYVKNNRRRGGRFRKLSRFVGKIKRKILRK